MSLLSALTGVLRGGLEESANIGSSRELLRVLTAGSISSSGVSINNETAMKISAVNGSVKILAESEAGLPISFFTGKRGTKGRVELDDHPLIEKLQCSPNRFMTAVEFREMMMQHMLFGGDGYSFINKTRTGKILEFLPISPSNVMPEFKNGRVSYVVRGEPGDIDSHSGVERTFRADQIFHLKGLAGNGITGRGVLRDARDTFGLALSEQIHASRMMGAGAKPSGVLEYPGELGETLRESLEKSFNKQYSGAENAGKTIILEDGMEWKKVGLSSQDLEFIASRKFSIADIARFFRVPLHLLAELDRATFSNIEQQSIDFVRHSLMPWLIRWEQAIKTQLLTREERLQGIIAEHVVDGLLRGDLPSRYDAYESAILSGWMTRNEARAKENLPAKEGADELLQQMNMEQVRGVRGRRSGASNRTSNQEENR